MSPATGLDPALLEAAIRRKDAGGVRDLLAGATEPDRRACAKALKDLLTEPGLPDLAMMMMPIPRLMFTERPRSEPPSAGLLREIAEHNREAEKHRARGEEQLRTYREWREIADSLAFQLAALGLAGGVAAAAKALEESAHSFDRTQPDDLVIAVLADRRPDWLADLIGRHLSQGWSSAWRLARGLVRLGLIPRPDGPEYTTSMPTGAREDESMTPSAALLADPGLLDDEVWRLFTVPEAGAALDRADSRIRWLTNLEQTQDQCPDQTWSQALALLSRQGHLDRGRLIDACLDAFTRDFHPNRVSWYATLLGELDPAIEEMSDRGPKYLGLLAVASKTAVTLGQAGAKRLLEAGKLDVGKLLDASAPALLYPQKSIAIAQLKLVEAVMTAVPAAKARAAAVAAIAFGHQRQDVQEAALAIIRKRGLPPSGPALDEIRSRVPDLSPSLAAQLADLLPADGQPEQEPSADLAGELAGLERRIGALPAARADGLTGALSAVRRGEVPGPGVIAPGAGAALAAPVTDPDELVHLLTALIEDAGDAIAAERVLAGAVRLSGLPDAQRRKAAAPLLKRAESVIREDSMFAGDVLASDIALVTWAWAGRPLPEAESDREKGGWRPDQYAVSGTGRALTMAGIFSARAWEAARTIAAGRGGLLLAEPETDRGTISPDGLLDRVHRLVRQPAGGAPPSPHDRDVALLRLGPGATDSLWSAWADLVGRPSETLGETYRIINSPLNFEAVAGTPDIGEEDWRDPDRVLLARTAGPVPAAPGCPSWQLLTRLADPLADYLPLTDVARFERHYEQFVAGWAMICPWQPELAAAHLLRPLSEGLTSRTSPATTAISALSHPGHPLGPVGHLALTEGLSGTEADTRIAAAELWAAACADGRLDPALAAVALAAGAAAQLVKLNRVAESLERASHSPLAARRVVETVCAATDLISASPPNLHLLIELAARLGSSFGAPALPDGLRELASRRRGARLNVTAAQLVAVAESQAAGQRQAAVQALSALVTRAEARH